MYNSNPSQDTEYFQYPRMFLHALSHSVPAPKAQEATTDVIFFHQRLVLPVLELHINRIVKRVFLLCLLPLGIMFRDSSILYVLGKVLRVLKWYFSQFTRESPVLPQ